MRVASPGVYADSSIAYFGPGRVGGGDVGSFNRLFNSNGNWNANRMAVRPVASIHCGYIIMNYIRDNIETNHSPITM